MAFVLLASSFAGRAHADAPLPGAETDAVLLARSADRARLAGRFSEAEASYRASLSLARDPVTELSLALTLAAEGKALQAAPLLARLHRFFANEAAKKKDATDKKADRKDAIDKDADDEDASAKEAADSGHLERARRALADVRREVATLNVDTGVAGALVEVDGVSIGRSPLPDPVFVSPGSHTVRASKDGHHAAGATFDAAGGTTYAVKVVVAAVADSASRGGVSTGGGTPAGSRMSGFFAGAAGGARMAGIALTAAGLVAGLSAFSAAELSDDDARAAEARLRRSGVRSCPPLDPDAPDDCAVLESALSARGTASAATGVLLVGAGAAGVATFFSVFFLPPTRLLGASGRLDFTLSPIAGPAGGGVSLEASW